MQSAVTQAIANGDPAVTIKGGAYRFHDTNFEIFGARNLAILSPEPVTLWFGAANGINITNSEDPCRKP